MRPMPRAIWSGSISFGLVNVPVKLYSAVSQKDVHFNQFEEGTGARIKQKRVSEKSGKEVPYEKVVKGYELTKGKYVMITKEELEAASPKASRMIEIEDFVDLDEIDPIYFENTYYLAPDGEAAGKAYTLLQKAMEETNKVGIGRFVMRTKQYLGAIRPMNGVLGLHTMLFADEVVDKKNIDELPSRKAQVNDRELKMALSLVDSLASDFKPEKYRDTYRDDVLAIIKRKAKGEEIVVAEEPEEQTDVVDLLAALEASLAKAKSGRAAPNASAAGSGSRAKSTKKASKSTRKSAGRRTTSARKTS